MAKGSAWVQMGLWVLLAGCGGRGPVPASRAEAAADGAPVAAAASAADASPAADAAPDAAPAPATAPDAAPDAAPPAPPQAADEVRGTVSLTVATYCGGAAPRPGQEMSHTGPAGGRKLYVRAAKNGKKVATVTTDASGAFSVHLPKGSYCLIDAQKADDTTPASQWVDGACLASYRSQCDAQFTMPHAEPLAVGLSRGCFGPCYHGPMPP